MTENISLPNTRIEYSYTLIVEIASVCDFERVETYEENIDQYESSDYSYIPLPTDGKYYDVSDGSLEEFNEEQWVWLENTALSEIPRLLDHDFLLIYDQEDWFEVDETGVEVIEPISRKTSDETVYTNPYELVVDWPEYSGEVYEILKEKESLYIVTLADVNDRRIRKVLYQHISGIEIILSRAVEQAYPEGEYLLKNMSDGGVEEWKEAQSEAGQLHPSEYMYLGELKHVSSNTIEILDALGYEGSGKEFNDDLRGINELRNKVMHPTKNLILDRNDLRDLIQKLKRLEEFIERAGGKVDRVH